MENRPFGGELFHDDGQTDMMKHPVALRNFSSTPNKQFDSCSYQKGK